MGCGEESDGGSGSWGANGGNAGFYGVDDYDAEERERRMGVIVGATGSGKTGVAVEISEFLRAHDGVEVEIISADSRAIYQEMDVGTAKPTRLEQKKVQHWGIDLVKPDERFTVVDFKKYAEKKILEIEERGAVPLMVGGTGLYVDAVIYNYQFTQASKKMCSDRKEMSTKFKVFGIVWKREELRERLRERVYKLFVQELFMETEKLAQHYDWQLPAMKSNIYQFAWQYLKGECSLEEARERAVIYDWQLARRQMTWFRRNAEIQWLSLDEIREVVIKFIQDEQGR